MAPSFKFVYIPADRHAAGGSSGDALRFPHCSHAALTRRHAAARISAQPMEELEQELVPGKEVECLTNRLQEHFRCGVPRPPRRLALRAAAVPAAR